MMRWALILLTAGCVTEPTIETVLLLSHEAEVTEWVQGQSHCEYTLYFEAAGVLGGYLTLDHARVEVWGGGKLAAEWDTYGYLTPATVHVGQRRSTVRWAYTGTEAETMEVRYRWWYLTDGGSASTTHTVICG